MSRLLFLFVLSLLIAPGCARYNDGTWKAPLIYRIDIQQGNVVDQSMIDKLKPGMDKKQVKYIMGSPLIIDTFHSNRWDYVYSFEPGRGEREQRRVTLFFNGDKLAYVEGDVQVTDKPRGEEDTKKDRSVAVPLENDNPGFFKRMFTWKKKNTADIKPEDSAEATEAPAATSTTGVESGTDTTEPPATSFTTGVESGTDTTSTGTEPATTGAQTTVEPVTTTESSPETPTKDSGNDTTKVQSTAGNTQEKNLLRRLWDRMTKSDIDSNVDMESEQTRRDAEVLKGAGGEINQ